MWGLFQLVVYGMQEIPEPRVPPMLPKKTNIIKMVLEITNKCIKNYYIHLFTY